MCDLDIPHSVTSCDLTSHSVPSCDLDISHRNLAGELK